MKDTAVTPEVLGIFKQVPLVRRDVDGNALGHRARVALALVAMVVRVQDAVHLGHADLAQQFQDVPRAEIDEQGAVAILQHVDVAGVA